jgi:peptide/nickel transport system substrate-binding protein
MKRSLNAVSLVLLFMVTLMLLACGKPETDARQAADAKGASQSAYEVDVIRLAGGDWGYPTPFAHYPRGPGGFKMCLIFDSLLERDEKGLVLWLAEKYEVSNDGMTYRFTIRKGVRWHDGTPLTAQDVAFSIDYANSHPATWSYIFETVASVETEADRIVQVRLKTPHAAMLYNIGRTRIIPKHIWEKVDRPKEFTTPEAVIGCGPYRLTHYSKEHGTYRFEAFEAFWGPKPRVRVVEFVPVGEPILAYESGKIDLTRITPDVLPRFEKDPTHKIVQSPAFWGYRLLMNMGDVACLRLVAVRQALTHAIDRRELVAKVARGAAVPGSLGILPPDHVMAAKNTRPYPFNPQQARILLDQAGCGRTDAHGMRLSPDGQPLVLDLLCSSREVRMAELIRQQLKTVGIGLTIRSVDGKTRDAQVRGFNYQLAILGHGGWGGDPDYLASRFAGEPLDQSASPSRSRLPGFDVPELMPLLKRQQTEIDPQQRRRLITEIQKMLAEHVPEIPLYYTTGYSVYRPATYDGWMFMFDHHELTHSKLSYLARSGAGEMRSEIVTQLGK